MRSDRIDPEGNRDERAERGREEAVADLEEAARVSAGRSADRKTSFDDIYDQPDPRSYFRTLGPFEYQIPHHAEQLVRRLLHTKELVGAAERRTPTVLDVCCSYGQNAALLNHAITLEDLYIRYGRHDGGPPGESGTPATSTPDTPAPPAALRGEPDSAELARLDREYFAAHRRYDAVRALGLDAAEHAVGYARQTGLLDAGFAEDLEHHDPGPELCRALADVSLVTVTGGVGYVTARTFDRLARHFRGEVWVLALVIRTVGYDDITRALAAHGLTTVKGDTTYVQRRFTDPEEERHAIEAVQYAGVSPEGRESTGYYHADLFLSGPADQPVAEVLREVQGH